tara:strand:- start:143 stop:688 length:546 start_codon:yes stop_codon:yes gene_type:complete
MRIISGSKKSITIRAPKDLPSRPTTDKVKESLFNILVNRFKIDEVKALDLFAGTGNISYEFSSRGAKKIISVDNNLKCIKFIKETSVKHGFDIITKRKDYIDFLKVNNESFDIIFVDPPYLFSKDQYFEILTILKQKDVLLDNGEIIIEHSSNISLAEKNNKIEERKYGSSILSFIKKASL